MKDRKVLIAGAGIGGLTTALALERMGYEIDIYEAAPELKPVGAGILLAPNALQVLERLGIVEEIKARGHELTGKMMVADKQLRPIQSFEGIDERGLFGHSSVTIHRGALQEVLLGSLKSSRVHTGKKCRSVQQDGERVRLVCEDGSEAQGDLLLGADGIHSVVREHLFPGVGLRYSGETCWRGVADFAPGERWSGRGFELWGRGYRLGLMPISERQVYWFSTLVAKAGGQDASPEQARQEHLERFRDFGGPALPVLEHTPAAAIIRRDLYDFKPMARWVEGRIGLLGDAAHATTPNMGQGGGQAIEDAWALQQSLECIEDIPQALLDFQERRRPKASMVVKNSYLFGKLAQLRNPLLCGLRNWFLRQTPRSVLRKQLEQLYSLEMHPRLPA